MNGRWRKAERGARKKKGTETERRRGKEGKKREGNIPGRLGTWIKEESESEVKIPTVASTMISSSRWG